jgi:hypothetical protein
VSATSGDQQLPQVVSDGAGGAIVVWEDHQNGNWDIYAQRVDASGTPLWTAGGIVVCDEEANQYDFYVIADGAGGAIIVWEDERNFYLGQSLDLFAQKISSDGIKQWSSDGATVAAEASSQQDVRLITDGAGGAILTWEDRRNDTFLNNFGYDVYAARLLSNGNISWEVALVAMVEEQYNPEMTTDGAGGAIVSWEDGRNSPIAHDIYIQRVSSAGVVQWTPSGSMVKRSLDSHFNPNIVTDGASGAVVVWVTSGPTDNDLYAQRVNPDSTLEWAAGGVVVCDETTHQQRYRAVSDGNGGVVVMWYDDRAGAGNDNIYAQRINGTGAQEWVSTGLPISTAAQDQYILDICTNGEGGAIAAWMDQRHSTDEDIFAYMVTHEGTFVATMLKSYSAVYRDEAVTIEWQLSEMSAGAQFMVSRTPAQKAKFIEIVNPDISRNGLSFRFVDDTYEPGVWYRYRVAVEDNDGQKILFETDPVRTPMQSVELYQNYPNPFNPSTIIPFSLPRAANAKITIFNPKGQQVRALLDKVMPAGDHGAAWDGLDDAGEPVASGVYFYRLKAGKTTITKKMTLMK